MSAGSLVVKSFKYSSVKCKSWMASASKYTGKIDAGSNGLRWNFAKKMTREMITAGTNNQTEDMVNATQPKTITAAMAMPMDMSADLFIPVKDRAFLVVHGWWQICWNCVECQRERLK